MEKLVGVMVRMMGCLSAVGWVEKMADTMAS